MLHSQSRNICFSETRKNESWCLLYFRIHTCTAQSFHRWMQSVKRNQKSAIVSAQLWYLTIRGQFLRRIFSFFFFRKFREKSRMRVDRGFVNVLILSWGFMLVFTAFQTMGGIQVRQWKHYLYKLLHMMHFRVSIYVHARLAYLLRL